MAGLRELMPQLIYLVVQKHQSIPTTSIIILAAIYGLQAVVFILNRKFEMIGWMVRPVSRWTI